MKNVRASLALLFVLGCASRERAIEVPPARAVRLPPSALTGAVGALEALAANRPADALVQVRALEASSVEGGRGAPADTVRVFLHLSVYAPTSERARAAFQELRAQLEEAASVPRPLAPVDAERGRSAVGAPSWDLLAGDELVSYSDSVRLELAARAAPASASGGHLADEESVGVEEYVRGRAAEEGIGDLDLLLRSSAATPGVTEVRCRIADAPWAEGHARAELGAFLASLESESPAARVTELSIERSRNAPDATAPEAWALEALLVVRVPTR